MPFSSCATPHPAGINAPHMNSLVRLIPGFALVCAASSLSALTIDFSDVTTTIPPAQAYTGPGGGIYYNGSDSAGGFSSNGAHFANSYNPSWGSWTGWSYSTTSDSTTAGWDNQYSAFPGAHTPGTPYGVAYVSGFASNTITLPTGIDTPLALTLTNSTYAYLSMLHGDGFSKRFGGASGNDADWFLLTISGSDALGSSLGTVDFYLADFRFADNALDYIVSDWTTVDLSGLGSGVRTLNFALTSSDNGLYGMNTPSYFALANVTAVPEPSAFAALAGIASLAFVAIRRRRV